jgi:hypothetical protein
MEEQVSKNAKEITHATEGIFSSPGIPTREVKAKKGSVKATTKPSFGPNYSSSFSSPDDIKLSLKQRNHLHLYYEFMSPTSLSNLKK